MNLHPLIANTVALWQLQTDFKDSSGNGLDLSPVDVTTNLPTTAPGFTPLSDKTLGIITNDACLVGVDLDVGARLVKLMAPVSPLLQLTGPMTVEWLMVQKFTFELTYFACCVPSGRSGGVSPDRIGSLYTLYSDSGDPFMADQHDGSGVGVDGFPGYNDHTLFNWADHGRPQAGDWHTHHFAVVRDAAGHWTPYRDGVTTGAGLAGNGTNVSAGTEQFFLGSIEAGATGASGLLASVRVLNVARSAGGIATDANLVLAACGGGGGGGGANAGGGNTSAATAQGLVYDAVAAAQFGMALRQGPRS